MSQCFPTPHECQLKSVLQKESNLTYSYLYEFKSSFEPFHDAFAFLVLPLFRKDQNTKVFFFFCFFPFQNKF